MPEEKCVFQILSAWWAGQFSQENFIKYLKERLKLLILVFFYYLRSLTFMKENDYSQVVGRGKNEDGMSCQYLLPRGSQTGFVIMWMMM